MINLKKAKKRSGFVIYLFTAVKSDSKFSTRFVIGYYVSTKKVYERGAFLSKMVYKRIRSWSSGRSLWV